MIVRHVDELKGTDREVDAPNWTSRRILLASDGMGFSLHETIIRAGTSTQMCYRHHLEAVFCVEGTGRIRDLATGDVHEIVPGTTYALDRHDEPHHSFLVAHEEVLGVRPGQRTAMGLRLFDGEDGFVRNGLGFDPELGEPIEQLLRGGRRAAVLEKER